MNAGVVTPVELIKIRLQNQTENTAAQFNLNLKERLRSGLRSSLFERRIFYNGPIDCIVKIFKEKVRHACAVMRVRWCVCGGACARACGGACVRVRWLMWGVQGFPGLWKGMSATVYREVPGYMGQFVVYEYIKQYVPSHTHITAHAAHAHVPPHTRTHDRTRTQLINWWWWVGPGTSFRGKDRNARWTTCIRST